MSVIGQTRRAIGVNLNGSIWIERRSLDMSSCSVCGEDTQLIVAGTVICVKCEEASPEERKIRSEQREGLPVRAAIPVAAHARPHRAA
jgi:hypothetical protein